MMRVGNLILGAVFAFGLLGTHDASERFTRTLNARETWAESLSNSDAGIFFSASGPASRTLNIALMPDRRDPAHCDSVRATLLANQDFLVDAYNRGFREIDCVATDADGKVTTLEDRIVPPAPERSVPTRHTATTSETSA